MLSGFLDWLGRLPDAISHEMKIRRDRRALMTMQEPQLTDLGITRGEIDDYLRGRLPRKAATGPQLRVLEAGCQGPECCPSGPNRRAA